MSRDYAKRKPAPRKNQRNVKKSKKSSKLNLNLILALLIVVAFIAGLIWLKQTPPQVEAPTVSDVPSEQHDEAELPALPQEEWDFIKTLPGYEVEVYTEDKSDTGRTYIMQCGSFRVRKQAEAMRAKMAFAGFEPQLKPSANGWYRVVLGPYDGKREAEVDRHRLKQIGITTCRIWIGKN